MKHESRRWCGGVAIIALASLLLSALLAGHVQARGKPWLSFTVSLTPLPISDFDQVYSFRCETHSAEITSFPRILSGSAVRIENGDNETSTVYWQVVIGGGIRKHDGCFDSFMTIAKDPDEPRLFDISCTLGVYWGDPANPQNFRSVKVDRKAIKLKPLGEKGMKLKPVEQNPSAQCR